MAVTAALVYAGHNRLTYLVTASGGDGGSATITSTGAATPDLLTDSLAGPVKNLALTFPNGYGKLAAGALSQAQARALWLSDDPTSVVGNQLTPTAIARLTEADPSTGMKPVIDADVDGSGHPTIVVTALANGTAYLDLIIPGAIGV